MPSSGAEVFRAGILRSSHISKQGQSSTPIQTTLQILDGVQTGYSDFSRESSGQSLRGFQSGSSS